MNEMDLVALVIELKALVPTTIDNHMGRTLQRSALLAVSETNAVLAETLHNNEDQKPFTVSGLMGSRGLLYGRVLPGDRAWVRWTGLSAEVAAALLAYHASLHARLKRQEHVTLELDHINWAVTAVHKEGAAWAGVSSYQTLIDRQLMPPTHLTLNFVTPTTFRSQTVNMPLPLPSLVFGSLLSRWTQFTPHRLRDLPQDQVDLFIAHHVVIARHELRTALIRGKQGGKEMGFTGQTTFELLPKSDHLLKHAPETEALIQKEYRWFAMTLALLADFAFYSGVGRKTTTGMGMACDGHKNTQISHL